MTAASNQGCIRRTSATGDGGKGLGSYGTGTGEGQLRFDLAGDLADDVVIVFEPSVKAR